mgnify:FL=1|tara:strand:- start:302 stop:1021 length:720 start_codon:yes stop_codon:yes gene_type:complete
MAIIYSYPTVTPLGTDIALGSRIVDENGDRLPKTATVNYTIDSISSYAKEGFLNGITWRFVIANDVEGNTPNGTLSFDPYAYGIPFSSMTTVKVSRYTFGNKNALEYLQALVGQSIAISNPSDINQFGAFKLEALTEDPADPEFYDMALTFLKGNGNLSNEKLYYINPSAIGIESDKTYIFNQVTPNVLWTIQHNLGKYPSVTTVNSNNIVYYGNITYIDLNNLTIDFSAGFSGKAYLN